MEYRPVPTIGIAGDLLVGDSGTGNLPDHTLAQYGLDVNFYFVPIENIKFYLCLVEFRMA